MLKQAKISIRAASSHALFVNSTFGKNILIVESSYISVQKWDYSRWSISKHTTEAERHPEPLHQDLSSFVNIYNKTKSAGLTLSQVVRLFSPLLYTYGESNP